jgi:hypothetical protein
MRWKPAVRAAAPAVLAGYQIQAEGLALPLSSAEQAAEASPVELVWDLFATPILAVCYYTLRKSALRNGIGLGAQRREKSSARLANTKHRSRSSLVRFL